MATLEDRFFSVYFDGEYQYNNRYIMTASLRADASNYQARDVRDKFSPFWSIGGGWILSREDFMGDVEWINNLKLRASIGESGLAAGKDGNATVTTVGTYPGSIYHTDNDPFNSIAARGNSTLTWEKTRTFDVGLDFRLWDDKLYGGIEYYNKYSYDVLSSATVPTITQGVASSKFNNGAISNKGVELTLGTRMTIAGDLKWNGWMNLSYNKNQIREYLIDNTSTRPSFYP
jgi:outer membrane receptor protein involved in Fe transport